MFLQITRIARKVFGTALLIAVLSAVFVDYGELYQSLLDYYDHPTLLKSLLFSASFVLTCILLLPGGILTYGAGVIFGFPAGVFWVALGANIGALIAFKCGRYLLRDFLRSKFGHDPQFRAIDRAVTEQGWKIILLSRLCPLIPFRFSNYLFGATSVGVLPFVVGTLLGTLPSAGLYVYLGSVSADLASNFSTTSSTTWALAVFGLVMLGAIVHLISRTAKAALKAELGKA